MGASNSSPLMLRWWVFALLCLKAHGDGSSEVAVKLLRTPNAISNKNSASFSFEVWVVGNGTTCRNCITNCKLDEFIPSVCEGGEATYGGLVDGNHTFEVCINGSQGVACATYNWTVDTIPPTAYITAANSLTSTPNISVNITFSEYCGDGGGFQCSSVNSCNLLVYGAGQVVPNTLNVFEENLKFSLVVSLSPGALYGRVVLIMDKNFCMDTAGNRFTRTENSTFLLHFDRRSVFVNIRIHIPEKLLELNSETRTVLATNKYKKLKVYLYFTEPVLNSSAEILKSLNTSQGSILPTSAGSLGNCRFGFQLEDISSMAIVTLSLDSNSVISRQGTPVSPVAPITFLYDSRRPSVRLSTTSSIRTRENSIPILIKFIKPVFGFNKSHITVSGGHLESFREMSRSMYAVDVKADDDIISVSVPENITADVAGNTNLASNILQVKHYSVPRVSFVLSTFATALFAVTSLAAGLLTISTASLLSIGAFTRPSSSLTSGPTRNLFRLACHIQVFALSRWLAVTLPLEYYEFARGLQWSIPYMSLPWETGHNHQVMVGSNSPLSPHSYSSKIYDLGILKSIRPKQENLDTGPIDAVVYGSPLTPMEYSSFFESQIFIPRAGHIYDPRNSNGWRDFARGMFWLAVISGCLILLHALLLFILKFKKSNTEKQRNYGALIILRFEIFLLILALPCLCKALASLIKGGESSGIVIGSLLLGVVSFLLLSLFLFLSIGITFGKLLHYKEIHREGQIFHWYQELIRVTLGPGKRGQWTWKNESNSFFNLIMFGPLFEDLRGPPKYMLSQFSGGNSQKNSDKIIASDDETEDAEAPFIQKLFGILRIYYTLIESGRRACLGILVGVYFESWSSKTPSLWLLCITSFQLFFMVLKKPFIKKRVQLVEIISVSCEIGIFVTCFVLSDREFSFRNKTKTGFFMLCLFLLSFLAQMINEWNALYRQTKNLDPDKNSFSSGLKNASIGFLLFFVPTRLIGKFDIRFPLDNSREGETGDPVSSSDKSRSRSSGRSSSSDKWWVKQLREKAKASFGREGGPNDPSSSQTKWSGLWSAKRSETSSLKSSVDLKLKSRGLHKDLEAIFASK